MRLRSPHTSAGPGFFWQGALIILPALILAGAGFYSLRQDDVLAQHEAARQATHIATELAQRLIPLALHFELPDAAAAAVSRLPDDELIQRLLRSPLAGSAFLVDPNEQLLYPPPLRALPPPDPLDPAELSPSQQDAWLALENMWRGDAPAAEGDLDAFAGTGPPKRFVALARFRTAIALTKAGQVPPAAALLRGLRELPPEVAGESGIPLRWLAGWQLAAVLPAGERDEMVNSLCGRLLLEPSPVADALFEKIAALHPSGHRWEAVRAAHQTAREFYTAFIADPEADSISLRGKAHWPLEQAVEGGRWIVAIPVETLAQTVDRLQHSMVKPAHYGVAVWAGSHRLLARPLTNPPLAAVASDFLPVNVEVFLTDPSAFAAQRRARTLRFGALIAMSAGAVVIGFFAAWHAFRRQQQLSEMKSNFVSSVSHELRAPIASVRLMAEELEHGDPPGAEKLRQYLRFIGQECRRLSAVIENVLDFSRREQGREHFDFEATDLSELVGETIALMQSYGSERGVQIEYTQRGHACHVHADGRAVQRLLVNLIDNAIKHSPDGKPVTVGLEFAKDRIFLWVEDSGPGIARTEHARIFERFYRVGSELRRQTQGVGLGLSIVKHLAEIHGGRVLVRSEPGHGSRFTVDLPLRRANLPQPDELPA